MSRIRCLAVALVVFGEFEGAWSGPHSTGRFAAGRANWKWSGWGGWAPTPAHRRPRGSARGPGRPRGGRCLQPEDGRGQLDQRRHRDTLEPVPLGVAAGSQSPLSRRLARESQGINQARKQIYHRLGTSPNRSDVARGDALNVRLTR